MLKKREKPNPQEYQNRKDAKPDQKVLLLQGKLGLCANLKERKRHVRKSYTEKSLDILK